MEFNKEKDILMLYLLKRQPHKDNPFLNGSRAGDQRINTGPAFLNPGEQSLWSVDAMSAISSSDHLIAELPVGHPNE